MNTTGPDKKILTRLSVWLLMLIPLLSGCSNEESLVKPDTESQGMHSCKVYMNVVRDHYSNEGDKRGALTWKEGDCIYVTIQTPGTLIQGKVVCEEDNDWTLYYEGILPNGTYTGRACYINTAATSDKDALAFSALSAVYVDNQMQCNRTSEGVWIDAMLRPQTGRIRFHGQVGETFNLSGVWHYSKYNIPDGTLKESTSPVTLTVGADGFTPYCYCSLPQTSRTLSVAYSNYLFSTTCDHPILDAGQAGYMELPTQDKHNGWKMTTISRPTVGSVTAMSIGTRTATLSASIISDGNAEVSDCGFCYSTSPNPSIEDMHVSYGVPTGYEFGKTINGLTDNTTYHVRAYAINQLGISYSDDHQFTTVAIVLPTLSSVTIQSEENGPTTFKAAVTSDGNGTISESGFVYATNEMPTRADSKLTSSDKESLSAKVEGLPIGTRYYVRAYATNEKGTAYGIQASFIAGGGRPNDDDINRPEL